MDEELPEFEEQPRSEETLKPLCCRCYDETDELFPPNCSEKPELLVNVPIGMYHCPECGAMLLAGIEHGWLCRLCLERRNPAFD